MDEEEEEEEPVEQVDVDVEVGQSAQQAAEQPQAAINDTGATESNTSATTETTVKKLLPVIRDYLMLSYLITPLIV